MRQARSILKMSHIFSRLRASLGLVSHDLLFSVSPLIFSPSPIQKYHQQQHTCHDLSGETDTTASHIGQYDTR